MKQMTCIVCPNGCQLEVREENNEFVVTGNRCPRGEKFAITEMTAPMRTICTTVGTVFEDVPVVPVRVSGEIPKGKIFDVMNEINKVVLDKRLGTGEAVISDVLGLGVDVIITSDVLRGDL